MDVRKAAEAARDYLVSIRREFHQHPELSMQEFRTAQRIEEELDRLGIPHTRVGETGVLGTLRGKKEGGRAVVLRADIDALPINAVSYLFRRDEIPPELTRNIMLYCLDCFGEDGSTGRRGTSRMAMMFLSNWLNGYGEIGHLAVSSRYLSGREVNFSQNGPLRDALRRGGAAVVRLDLEGWHYVLLTRIEGGDVYLFDPYYHEGPFDNAELRVTDEHPCSYNRIVPVHYFEREEISVYSLGPFDTREAILLFNTDTELTEDKTVEYFI